MAYLVVFLCGFCTMSVEVVAGRLLAPHFGMSVYTWTGVIGVVLGGISLGSYVGGKLADRYPGPITLGWLVFASAASAFVAAPMVDLVEARDILSHVPIVAFSLPLLILTATGLAFGPPALFLGMIPPAAARLAIEDLASTGSVAGRIFACSALGSILGTFATGFFLISWLGSRPLLFALGVGLIALAPFAGGFWERRRAARYAFLLLLLSVPAGVLFRYTLEGLYASVFKPQEEGFYYFEESNYYTIRVRERPRDEGEGRLQVLYLDRLIHSYTDLDDPTYLEYRYLRIFEEVFRRHAAGREEVRVLFLGGGGYTLPRLLEHQYPEVAIDVVEIDPRVTQVARSFLGISSASRIRTVNQDARWFLRHLGETEAYDVVFGDAFNDLSVPYHLTTRECAEELKSVLKPDGLLLANIIDDFRRGRFLLSYLGTVREVFGAGRVFLLPVDPGFEQGGQGTFVVAASRAPLEPGESLLEGDEEGLAAANIVPSETIERYLAEFPWVLLTDDYVPADQLVAPLLRERFTGEWE